MGTVGRARTLSDFWQLFASQPLTFAPGSQWEYSNTNFLVLGAIVEKGFGGSFASVARQRIFEPVGMPTTSREPTSMHLARGYTRIPSGTGQADPSGWLAFARALMQGAFVGRETIALIVRVADYTTTEADR